MGKTSKEYSIPDSVKSIGDNAFSNCINLESVIIPDSVVSIGSCAFANCKSIRKIVVPNSVKIIESNTFSDCSNLESVVIPDSVVSIGDCAFNECKSLKNMTLPDGIESIGNWAFYYCTSLKSILIPDSVTNIGRAAFCGCSDVEKITIPDSITSLDRDADVFGVCSEVKTVYYKGSEEQWKKTFGRKSFRRSCPFAKVYFNCKSLNNLADTEKEIRRLLKEGNSEKEIYQALKSEGDISDNDIVDAMSRVDSTSPMVISFCNRVILPDIALLFKKSNGSSKYTIEEVADLLYSKYPESLVNKSIILALGKEYLVD